MPGQDILADFSPEVVKVPLGFIRCLQIPMTILAIACVAGYSQDVAYTVSAGKCPKPATNKVTVHWKFPFNLDQVMVPLNSCQSSDYNGYAFHQEYSSTANFFVAISVISMLYASAALALYLLALSTYENDSRIPRADCLFTSLLAFLWVLACIMWWAAVVGIQIHTKSDNFFKAIQDKACKTPDGCKLITSAWSYSGLNVSALAGLACVVLFAANTWFVFKETVWFHERRLPQLPVFPVGVGSRPNQSGTVPSSSGSQPPLSGAEVSAPRTGGYEAM